MNGFIFKEIEIYNFKYVSDNRPIKVNYNESNIVILDGQNGYGKTTLFDAIELLLTGSLKHFNSKLLNRGTESLGVLANDLKKDIKIIGKLSCGEKLIVLKRIFCAQNDFKSAIFWNDEETTQDDLYRKLNFSAGLFDLGIYISQSESLTFLQNRYKDRKDKVSGLLQDQEITAKITLLKNIKSNIDERAKRSSELFDKHERDAKAEIDKLCNELKAISLSDGATYFKLFPDEQFSFDVENVKTDKSYSQFVKPLDNLEYFLKNYNEYDKYIFNLNVDKAINTSTQIYIAYYYRKEIQFLETKKNLLNILQLCRKLSQQISKGDFCVETDRLSEIGIDQDIIQSLNNLIKSKQVSQNSLNATNKTLVSLNDARQRLFIQYKAVVENKKIQDKTCPFCGSALDNVEEAYIKATEGLNDVQDSISKQILETNKQIETICNNDILPVINDLLKKNVDLLVINDSLNQMVKLRTDEIEDLLIGLDINNFSASKDVPFSLDNFIKDFDILKTKIEEKRKVVNVFLNDEEIEMFKNIHFKYYKNLKPEHTVEQIKKKKQYIAYVYLNQINKDYTEAQEKYKQVVASKKQFLEKINSLENSLSKLIEKYDEAYKDYQTKLVNAIKLPMLVYSGRIIQNYPLGLGIKAVLRTNQLVFEPSTKKNVDVYNILSTGQLNGLAISILLAIRNVYCKENGMDILLIDDPLQTIDEVSAISLADLLTQQKIGQIILSTHEDQKCRLLNYKFKQANLKTTEINMQNIYLQSKLPN